MNSSMSTGDAGCCAADADAIPPLTAKSGVSRIIMAFSVLPGIFNTLSLD